MNWLDKWKTYKTKQKVKVKRIKRNAKSSKLKNTPIPVKRWLKKNNQDYWL